ncbi:hypothetical protein BDF14DRAFT_1728739 [Spinellus fusiger]|nr:hypothetical protein BDF14DRAFT_1728739 [Spinellus fusiger]
MSLKGTEKTLQKLKDSVESGNYYETHQMYRTVARRYNKQQKHQHAIQLLHDGAVSLMKHGQSASGSDLSNYMLETYTTFSVPVDATSLDRVVEILSLYPRNEPGRKQFINNAFSWTQKHGQYPEGDPELHDYVGTMFFYEGHYNRAEEHLLVGTDHSAELLGKLALAWALQEKTPSKEKGKFIARTVLQYLAMKSIHHASLAFNSFLASESQPQYGRGQVMMALAEAPTELVIYTDHWLNFSQLMLLTVQRDASDLFVQLRKNYESVYREHKGFDELLDDIANVFFNIPKPRRQGNMLQDMLSSLFAGPSTTPQRATLTHSNSPTLELD